MILLWHKLFLAKRCFCSRQYVMALEETKMKGIYFYLDACTQGKMDSLYRKRAVSPTHTDVRVLFGFCFYSKHRILQVNRKSS